MGQYDETHHAFLILVFYKVLSGIRNGKDLFVKATQMYGEQRGLRMALRALRDEAKLNMASYLAYGEWEPTAGAFDINFEAENGVLNETVRRCPWADTWKKHNLPETGEIYCREIDTAIVRGFNSALVLNAESNICGAGLCVFHFHDPDIKGDGIFKQAEELKFRRRGKAVEDFAYHCGHLWTVFTGVIRDVLPGDAGKLTELASEKIIEEYGEEFLNTIRSFETVDFTRLGN
ncbi:MAG: L-2-amino-thiazoline-4-carboxylic acid hydrolase [Treponema sp.]|jgi:hypothetical protein|nr:L-2-amino-thiazoline-4-carboxylic acid hydrolase [Treponema sp.]